MTPEITAEARAAALEEAMSNNRVVGVVVYDGSEGRLQLRHDFEPNGGIVRADVMQDVAIDAEIERIIALRPHITRDEAAALVADTATVKDAAFDMLEALENLENDAREAMPATAWQMVRDAIAKARGAA